MKYIGGILLEAKCIIHNKPPPIFDSELVLKIGGPIFRKIRYLSVIVPTTTYIILVMYHS